MQVYEPDHWDSTERLKNEIEKLDNRVADKKDRLNNIQNMIFKANEKMD